MVSKTLFQGKSHNINRLCRCYKLENYRGVLMGRIQVQMIDSTVSFDWWRKLLQHFVSIGDELEIRCWKEETGEIQKASLYGTPMEDKSEVSVRGLVTVELLSGLLKECGTRVVWQKRGVPAMLGRSTETNRRQGLQKYPGSMEPGYFLLSLRSPLASNARNSGMDITAGAAARRPRP